MPDVSDLLLGKQRQVLWWRMISATFGLQEVGASFESMAAEMAAELDLPPALLDAGLGIDVLLHRYPKLKPHFDSLKELGIGSELETPPDEASAEQSADTDETDIDETDAEKAGADADGPPAKVSVAVQSTRESEMNTELEPALVPSTNLQLPLNDEIDLARTLAYSKLLLNVFGPNTRGGQCTAGQYKQWCDDVEAFEGCFGFAPGSLRSESGGSGPTSGVMGGSGHGISGSAPRVDDSQLREELVAMESDLIKRMEIHEVLKDDRLAARLTPSMPLVEQLLYSKSNLSGVALKNAKMLIRKYVDELAAVLRKEVVSASTGKIDRSVPPKRIFRNLDLKRTIWKNLHNFNPADERLYVDQLFYRHTSQKELNNYLIVVVDQSGSMVSAMVQCAILASIFAALPRVNVSLIAFDTNVIDLTPWVEDPFESLMRTNLGGGNDGPKAMEEARTHIIDPARTTMVWISDFYEFENDRPLFELIKGVKQTGVHFIPVGSVSGSGYFSVNEWFRKKLKSIGLPVLTGNIKKLIVELKKQLN